jgi:3-oxosteroid 1-dehydrogenase
MKKWICTVCGHIHEGAEPPLKCPNCGANADDFVELD